jgi:hypothetical protein
LGARTTIIPLTANLRPSILTTTRLRARLGRALRGPFPTTDVIGTRPARILTPLLGRGEVEAEGDQ